jgi:hypothetical protein
MAARRVSAPSFFDKFLVLAALTFTPVHKHHSTSLVVNQSNAPIFPPSFVRIILLLLLQQSIYIIQILPYRACTVLPSGRICLLRNKEIVWKKKWTRHMRCSHGGWAPRPARIIMHRIRVHMEPALPSLELS